MPEASEPSNDEIRARIGFLPYWMPGDARTWLTALLRDAAIQGWDVDECGRRATGLLEDWRKENPAPRVYFPGDMVPEDTLTINKRGYWGIVGLKYTTEDIRVAVPKPSPRQWQATVDRARAEVPRG